MDLFVEAVKRLHIPADVNQGIEVGIQVTHDAIVADAQEQKAVAKGVLAQIQKRQLVAHTDKIDGKINEDLWQAKHNEWAREELEIKARLCEMA